jgi:hypothetical protein
MHIDYLAIVVMSVCALTFYRAGKQERSWSILWAALSVIVSLLILRFLNWGVIGVFAGQAALFVGITIFRMRQKG